MLRVLFMGFFVNHFFDFSSLLVAVTGVIIALIQYVKANKFKRAKLLYDVLGDMSLNTESGKVLYSFEYGTFDYGQYFHGSEAEGNVDACLQKLNYICYLHHNRLLTHTVFNTFEYLLTRSISNRYLQDYLYNLYRFSERVKEKGSTNHFLYADLLEYGFGKGLFSRAAFSDPKA